jgi:hypothetical protein
MPFGRHVARRNADRWTVELEGAARAVQRRTDAGLAKAERVRERMKRSTWNWVPEFLAGKRVESHNGEVIICALRTRLDALDPDALCKECPTVRGGVAWRGAREYVSFSVDGVRETVLSSAARKFLKKKNPIQNLLGLLFLHLPELFVVRWSWANPERRLVRSFCEMNG